ncbi:hypothetical protein DERP_014650 [Dermatophagoides pteronyssinus]|uniref:Uncharacterized protein n=1 Tax=Dermatophagoides pteronyssinus TaxID=6956 RepID=A0ABQ8IU40_DERPT|nr:hypothetical protein DERP_014650 [Dermatophagoides pteronyssinus]
MITIHPLILFNLSASIIDDSGESRFLAIRHTSSCACNVCIRLKKRSSSTSERQPFLAESSASFIA